MTTNGNKPDLQQAGRDWADNRAIELMRPLRTEIEKLQRAIAIALRAERLNGKAEGRAEAGLLPPDNPPMTEPVSSQTQEGHVDEVPYPPPGVDLVIAGIRHDGHIVTWDMRPCISGIPRHGGDRWVNLYDDGYVGAAWDRRKDADNAAENSFRKRMMLLHIINPEVNITATTAENAAGTAARV